MRAIKINRIVNLVFINLIFIQMSNHANTLTQGVKDPHTCAKPEEALIQNLKLDLEINFEKKQIEGTARYKIKTAPNARELWLDTRGLNIKSVSLNGSQETRFQLMPEQKYLGRPLRIEISPETKEVTINYQTTQEPGALQWLNPEQTEGGKMPFLFTQGQAILSRTWFPVQDSPGIRFSWSAEVKVPENFMVVMSGNNPKEKSASGSYHFRMDLPVPAYLIALAAGDLEFRTLGERCGVYAEPAMIDRAAYELADTENMLRAAEELYGTYQWGRYDLIVLPPSFPFGGMENPKLTFATPTIIAGDRSLTALVAHELAHSWSGNLVTNATWNDFWLNEGFTVYFERRIMEALYGKDYADMLALLGYQDLMGTVAEMGAGSEDSRLKLDLAGRDPDDGMNDVAYEKGYFLLCRIEEIIGRTAFDNFLKQYFKTFSFQSIQTESFLKYLYQKLPQLKNNQDEISQWIYQPGIPPQLKVPVSNRFVQVDSSLAAFLSGKISPEQMETSRWSTHEWLQFIRQLPANLSIEKAGQLDLLFRFSNSENAEIQAAWFEKMIPTSYNAIDKPLDEFLMRVGRRKFVLPLYKAMLKNPARLNHAKELYAKARSGYHAVTAASVDDLFSKKK